MAEALAGNGAAGADFCEMFAKRGGVIRQAALLTQRKSEDIVKKKGASSGGERASERTALENHRERMG